MSFAKSPRGRTCESCIYFHQEWDGEYGEIYCGDFCEKPGQEYFGNLKSFPFAKLMPCFEAEFWHTEFAAQYPAESDPKDEHGLVELTESAAFKAYLAKYNKPGIPIPEQAEGERHGN